MIARIVAFAVALSVTVSTHAAFTGVKLVIDPALNTRARAALAAAGVPDADTAVVIRMYALFSAPGDGQINTVLRTDFMDMFPTLAGISFYQDPLGSDTAPNSGIFPFVPTLEFDTFGTIGVLDSINGDSTSSTVGSMDQFNILGGWFNANPPNLDGAAIDQGGFFGTLLFQITVIGPGLICSNVGPQPFTLFNGAVFVQSPGGATKHRFLLSPPCRGNLNGFDLPKGISIINAGDLAILLARWGPTSPAPCDFSLGNADLNLDGVVDSGDLAILLANWGCGP